MLSALLLPLLYVGLCALVFVPRMGLAFRCASPAEVDATYAEVVAAGHVGLKEPWDAFWGQRYAQLRDPDGNPVDLYAALA